MTNIIRRKPTAPKTIWDEIFNDDEFTNLFSLVPRAGFAFPEFMKTNEWVPRIDVRETDDAVIFSADVPGMNDKDIEITIENNVMTLKGERKFERDEKKENYHRIERQYGMFQRSFNLPMNLDLDKVDAKYKDGILEIKFPKREEAKPRKIEVGISKD